MIESVEGVAWADLSLLLAAVECRSLSGAAEVLRIGQSTASRRLARLEKALGGSLFDRTPEGLLPTELARQLVPHARAVEAEMAEIERIAGAQQREPEGRVRLAVPDGMASGWLMNRLPDFFARFPSIELDVVAGSAVLDLVRREADIAVRFVRPTAADLVVRPLGPLEIAPYVRADLADHAAADLRWLSLVDPERRFLESRWIDRHVQPSRSLVVSHWSAMVAGVRAGLGAALLSPRIAEPLGLVRVRSKLPELERREILLVYHRSLRSVPRIMALREWLTEAAAASFGSV